MYVNVIQLRFPRGIPHGNVLSNILRLTSFSPFPYRLLRQILQKRDHLDQLPVLHVVDKRHTLDPIVRLELKTHRGVIDHHHRVQVPPQQPQILH